MTTVSGSGDAIISSAPDEYRPSCKGPCLSLAWHLSEIDKVYYEQELLLRFVSLRSCLLSGAMAGGSVGFGSFAPSRQTGMNVVRMGEGAWSVWEPEEGRYEFCLV